jgi:hypothetical protein
VSYFPFSVFFFLSEHYLSLIWSTTGCCSEMHQYWFLASRLRVPCVLCLVVLFTPLLLQCYVLHWCKESTGRGVSCQEMQTIAVR